MKAKKKKIVLHPTGENKRIAGHILEPKVEGAIINKVPHERMNDEKKERNDAWFFFWDL